MKMNKIYVLFGIFFIFSAIGGGAIGSAITYSKFQSEILDGEKNDQSIIQNKSVYVEESEVIETVKEVSPAVVSIVISKDLPLYRQGIRRFGNDPFFNFGIPFQEFERDEEGNIRSERTKIGGGSGFIVSKKGLIVTNRHVVEDAEASYTVITSNGTEFEAEVLARDTLSDFAVIKLIESDENKLDDLSSAKLGNSDSLQIGQKVVAIGNALAEYQNTVTSGIVSGIGREITAGSLQGSESLINLIQTDAAINPGNSGGPLVNLNGEVVGINTAMASGAQSIGFAIPINDVKSLIDDVQANGKIVRPFLGVRFMILNKSVAQELKIDVEQGALLIGNEERGEFAVIPGSPAEKAGLKIKDVILEVDGIEVDVDHPLNLLISKKSPGDNVKLKVWRSGETMDINLKLGEPE